MPDQSFFLAFSGLGVSLAGFAGIINALDRSPVRTAVSAYRIRNIVVLGLWLTFTALSTIAAYTATGGNLALTVRIGSAIETLAFLRGLLFDVRPGPAWAVEAERRIGIAILMGMALIGTVAVVAGSLVYLEVLMLVGLIGPVTIFYNTIRAATEPSSDAG